MSRILIIDDERNIRRTFAMVLQAEGLEVQTAATAEEGLEQLATAGADLVILDVQLPGMDGLAALREIKSRRPEQLVVMISGHGTVGTAVTATREGALDFLEKPCSRERLVLAVNNALKLVQLSRQVRDFRDRDRGRYLMIGESEAVKAIREQIARVAPTGARILIRGESGTGKELVARACHDQSDRRDKPFVKVNCAAIPEELIESELFGSVKGAYTGATADRDGKFLQADGGTLFLDEIGDMSLRAQAKVLRVLQEGEIEKVGGGQTLQVDVRVIAATNRNLEQDVKEGRFREDLFFRLNVVPIEMPPLRERAGDIPLLAEHFLSRYCSENDLPCRELSPEALDQLAGLPWLGNVRELHNIIERLAIMSAGQVIGSADLAAAGLPVAGTGPEAVAGPAAGVVPLAPAQVQAAGGLVKARQQFEAGCIRLALEAAGGNVSRAARLLGIDRTNLHKKIQSYELS